MYLHASRPLGEQADIVISTMLDYHTEYRKQFPLSDQMKEAGIKYPPIEQELASPTYVPAWAHSKGFQVQYFHKLLDLVDMRHDDHPSNGQPECHDGDLNSLEITPSTAKVQIGYWRKVNAVHGWFVRNCQNNVDECQEVEVSGKQLFSLQSEITDTIEGRKLSGGAMSNDNTELVPQSGCFFGTSTQDEWYWMGLEDTLRIIKRAYDYIKKGCTIHYCSSW